MRGDQVVRAGVVALALAGIVFAAVPGKLRAMAQDELDEDTLIRTFQSFEAEDPDRPELPESAEPDWQFEETSVIGDEYFMDFNSLKRDGNLVHYRQKIRYGPTLRQDLTTISRRPVFYDIFTATLDCEAKTVRRLRHQPQPVDPDTPMFKLLQRACEAAK